MERTITYDGVHWRVWVDAAPDRDRPKSGLELVFSGPHGSEIRRLIGPALLRALSSISTKGCCERHWRLLWSGRVREMPVTDQGGPMSAGEMIHVHGTVEEVLPNRMYRVRLKTGDLVLTTIAGRARRGLRVLEGDDVEVEMSPYDLSRGRITGMASDTTHTGGEA